MITRLYISTKYHQHVFKGSGVIAVTWLLYTNTVRGVNSKTAAFWVAVLICDCFHNLMYLLNIANISRTVLEIRRWLGLYYLILPGEITKMQHLELWFWQVTWLPNLVYISERVLKLLQSLETRRSRVQPPPRSATFFRGDWSWNIFYGHSLPSADSRRAVVSFWRKNVHNTG